MLKIGTGCVDITPKVGGWMAGMPREHGSVGIHDPLHARALVFDDGGKRAVIVSLEIVQLSNETADAVRMEAEKQLGIPASQIFLACSHSHSGPATIEFLYPRDDDFLAILPEKLMKVMKEALDNRRPAKVGIGRGEEKTISHYRRLKTEDGKIVMNWEPVDPAIIAGPAGMPDHEVGVMKIISADKEEETTDVLFHYTTHPNVLSGENFFITSEFPGLAARIIEEKLGGRALFINGAQGSSDIDGLKDRDWAGWERTGNALANAVLKTADSIHSYVSPEKIATGTRNLQVPARKVTKKEVQWAEKVMSVSSGNLVTLADGVTDEFYAKIILKAVSRQGKTLPLSLDGIAVGDMAFISFPGELFTEIGTAIKKQSGFKQTYIMGLTNGSNGYFPTANAISEGGFAVDIRGVDPPADEIIIQASVDLLRELKEKLI